MEAFLIFKRITTSFKKYKNVQTAYSTNIIFI